MPAGCFSPVWEGDKTRASVGSQDWTFAPSEEISSLLEALTEDFHPGCSASCSLYSLILSDASHKCFHCLLLIHLHTKSVLQKGLLKDTLLILIMALISFRFCFSLHVTHSFVYRVNIYGTSITCEILDLEFVNKDIEHLGDLYVRVNFI